MQIPPEKIHEIIERTDLVALISRHVELKRSGRSLKGLCPFHGEKTPSFHVFEEKRRFKCFGCEAGGDAIAFMRLRDGKSFVEAVRQLAQEAGVHLEEQVDPAARERAQLLEASELARRHFEERLWSPAGKAGRDYLARRGVSEELARQFNLGLALPGWNDLTDRLVKEGILEWGSRAGLVSRSEKTGKFYDAFRARLMIPIRSPEGRTVAFGARLLEELVPEGQKPGPKYLNSRESPLYRKSDILFALDLAREEIRRRRSAVLVEGYFDVIGLYSAGVKNAVALCSTALTAGHLAALSRADARELVLLLDGDAAGMNAVERLAGPILAAGASTRVATLPSGDDPDTFAARVGLAGVEKLVAEAPALSRHLLDRCLPHGRASSFEEKMAALARLTPIVEPMPAGIAKSLFVNEIAEHVGLAESEVRAHLLRQEVKAPPRPRPVAAPAAPARPVVAMNAHEELFVALLVADPGLRAESDARFSEELRSVELRLLLEGDKPEEGVASLPEVLRAPVGRRLQEIERTLTDPDARKRALRDASIRMRLVRVEEQISAKTAELRAAEEPEEIERLQAEHKQLAELRMRLRRRETG